MCLAYHIKSSAIEPNKMDKDGVTQYKGDGNNGSDSSSNGKNVGPERIWNISTQTNHFMIKTLLGFKSLQTFGQILPSISSYTVYFFSFQTNYSALINMSIIYSSHTV